MEIIITALPGCENATGFSGMSKSDGKGTLFFRTICTRYDSTKLLGRGDVLESKGASSATRCRRCNKIVTKKET